MRAVWQSNDCPRRHDGPRGPGERTLSSRRHSPRLAAYAALLLLALGAVQLAGSLLFYQAIDRQTVWEDHARRVAELLVVSERVQALGGQLTSPLMTTRHLGATVTAEPLVARPQQDEALERIARRIVTWEPTLGNRPLHLAIAPGPGGPRDLVGSIRLADGNWLNFRSKDISSMWPVALNATLMTLATAVICLGFGLIALRFLTRPLRRLSEAAEAIGQGRRVPIREGGPDDLRNLARSMNEMQDRIAGLLEDQARSFEAISHDLRTPLARQKIAADLVGDAEIAALIHASTDEMEDMLASLQQFLRAQHLAAEPEPVDLFAAIAGVIAPFGDAARLVGSGAKTIETYAEPLLLALRALVENAVRFGRQADVSIDAADGEVHIEIRDHGPGIPPDHFEDVLAPFFRLDAARARDTKGFGLGIPTAHRLLRRFGGDLALRNAPGGGLIARVRVPRPARADEDHKTITD